VDHPRLCFSHGDIFVEIMSRLYPVLSLVVIVVFLGRKGMLSVVAMMD